MKMMRKVPLIVILGSTGTGKTKLSIELAERFGGEILSADSMQVYANLDIATAKATKEEQSRAKHHLLDVAKPTEPYTVVNFRNAAIPIIEKLLAQSKLPIVVGGTNYYIESLLWDILISPMKEENENEQNPMMTNVSAETGNATGMQQKLSNIEMLTMSSQSLHDHLRTFDPESANRMHPNNKRKIMRAIEVYQQNGKTLTSMLKEQREKPGGNRLGGPLRYPHTILFWLRCNQEILNKRLDKRVDSMLEQGLLREIRAFYNEHKLSDLSSSSQNNTTISGKDAVASDYNDDIEDKLYTKGVLQTIGFKEFIPYLEQFNAANDQKIEEYLRLNDFQMPTEEEHLKKIDKKFNSNANNKSSINDSTTTTTTTLKVQQPYNDVPTAATSLPKSPPTSPSPPSPSTPTTTTSIFSSSYMLPMVVVKVEELPPGLELLNACLNELKLVTRRYSKKQIKWINNRFLASKDRQVPDLYELDTSDVSIWNETVLQRAINVIDCYCSGSVCEVQPMPKRQHPGANLNEETSNFCVTCERHFIGEYQWQLHLKSNKHKRRKDSLRKKLKTATTTTTEAEAVAEHSIKSTKVQETKVKE